MKVIATKNGFFGGNRIHVGQEFDVKEGVKGKWFTPKDGYKAPEPKKDDENPLTAHQFSRQKSESFVELMKRNAAPSSAVNDPDPDTKRKHGRPKKEE
jgi:hypothetical protein